MILISLDPGVQEAGVALWEDGELTAAFLARSKNMKAKNTKSIPDWQLTAEDAFNKIVDHLGNAYVLGTAAIEKMQVYDPEFQKGGTAGQNDLIDVTLMAGHFNGLCQPLSKTVWYRPNRWKGQLPKDVTEARVKKRLTDEEKDRIELPAKTLRHNVWDAIGIGLEYWRRWRWA